MIPRRGGPFGAWGLLAACLLTPPTFAADRLPVPVALRGALSPDGAAVSIQITVANRADRASEPGTLEVYLSGDGLVDPDDARLARLPLASLAPDGRLDVELAPLLPPKPPGRYYVVARVIGDAGKAAGPPTEAMWGAPLAIGPDLIIDNLQVTTGAEGATLTGRVVNRGTQPSAPPAIGAWWTTRSGGDRRAEGTAAATVGPGETVPFEVVVVAGDLPVGEYGIAAEVDPDRVIAESDDENNRFTADAAYFMGPDLAVAELSARQDGRAIVVRDAVINRGNRASAECGILFVLSRNGIWDPGDVSLGYRLVPALDPNGTSTAETRLALPERGLTTGRYFLLGKVDGANHVVESREANNLTLAPAPVDVRLPP
ncbi:MAG: CARDB domain-containing protein [Nitrospirota bacterium]